MSLIFTHTHTPITKLGPQIEFFINTFYQWGNRVKFSTVL